LLYAGNVNGRASQEVGFLFRSNIAVGDTGIFFVQLTHWDGFATILDGQGIVTFSSPAVINWTTFNLPITYFTGITPDTLQIVGLSSQSIVLGTPLPIPGSELELDSLVINTVDVGVIALDAPLTGCALSATESVTIEVENFGIATVTAIPVAYSMNGGPAVVDTLFTTLAPGATALFTFATTEDLSVIGAYNFDAWTADPFDIDLSNDSLIGEVVDNLPIISTFPYLQDWEAEPLCGVACGTPCNLVGAWTNPGGDDIDWTIDEDATTSLGTGPAVDHTTGLATGNFIYTEATGGCNPGATARLESPCFDLSVLTNPTLVFWYHMFGAGMGNLYVEVDSGAGYVAIDSIIGQQQTASTDPWLMRTVNLSAYTGIISIRFFGVTGVNFESDMAIDDIEIFQPPPNDVGVIAIDAPVSGCGLTATESVTIRVRNFGSSAVDSIPVTYTINGGPVVNDTIFPTLLSGDTAIFTFGTTADVSAAGTFIFDSWTNLLGDANNGNDSTLNYVVTNDIAVTIFPYLEDFESGTLGGFSNSATVGTLVWFNTAIRGTDAGHSNTQSAYFGNPVDTTYNTGATEGSLLTLPCLDFSTLTNIRLSFNYFLETEQFGGFDVAEVLISTDGVAFTALADNQGIGNLVDASGVWQNMILDLSVYAGNPTVYLRYSFNTIDNFANAFEGFYVDDINIYEQLADDVGVIAIDAPLSGCGLTASETVTVRVTNFGSVSQDTIPVSFNVDGGPAVTDTIFATILAGDTASFTFSGAADLSTPGPHSLDSWTSLTGDITLGNDSTVNIIVTHQIPVTVFPHFEDFEAQALCLGACAAACPLTVNWSNATNDIIDWTANEGPTSSGGTGPTVDHTTGLATGNYLYTEASGGCK